MSYDVLRMLEPPLSHTGSHKARALFEMERSPEIWRLKLHPQPPDHEVSQEDSRVRFQPSLNPKPRGKLSHVGINYISWRLICKEKVEVCYLNSDY